MDGQRSGEVLNIRSPLVARFQVHSGRQNSGNGILFIYYQIIKFWCPLESRGNINMIIQPHLKYVLGQMLTVYSSEEDTVSQEAFGPEDVLLVLRDIYKWQPATGVMAQCIIILVQQAWQLDIVPGAHIKGEREIQLHKVVLWPQHTCNDWRVHTYTEPIHMQTYTHTYK